ncbi:hypothetical protein GCM10009741_42720 [Kribbella lupini]|uniref:SGNH hydrolase-type esterase domain-containing protein n=1 Tax=Kribbella lupini TaxID=291602 RepID=A0ABN2B9N0_9ACTN
MVAGSTVVSAETAFAGGYGSGDLGDWQGLNKAIATPELINTTLQRNGLFMFGDSISVQDGKSLATLIASRLGVPLAVHNWSGRPTTPAVDALESWKTTYGLPSRILMATGTNDIFTPPVFAAQVDRTMALAGPTRKVFWVNVQAARTSVAADVRLADQRNSGWINLQLSEAQRRHPNLRIVHWAEFLAGKISRLTAYLEDGVHTTVPLGQDARNELIVQGIEAG